jgi:hypothetical protein
MSSKKWLVFVGLVALSALWWYWQQVATQPEVRNESADKIAPTAIVEQITPINAETALPTKKVVTAAPKSIDDYVDWQRELVASLIVVGDADSLLAAALILHALNGEDPVERRNIRRLLDKALAAAPSDRAIAAASLRVCRSMERCDAIRFAMAVRSIDVRNALGLLPELLDKIEKGDSVALASLATLHLDLYYSELVVRVARAIASAPTSPRSAPITDDTSRLQSELALRAVDTIEVPSYLAVGPSCQVRSWRNAPACDAIVRDLRNSELIALQRLALEFEAIRSDYRGKPPPEISDAEAYLNWVVTTKANGPPTPAQWIALLGQNRTELAATRAWLEYKGTPPQSVPRLLERPR